MPIAYLNGEFLPLSEAKVSVMDRGFLFGDGIYEVIPAFGGKPFRLEQHLKRLRNSLHEIYLEFNLSFSEWKQIFEELLIRNQPNTIQRDQSIYLQITRGPATERSHIFPKEVKPTVFAYSIPLNINDKVTLSKGAKAVTLPDQRWPRCNIKSITLLANLLASQQANQLGAREAILIRDGYVMEGASSNIFVVQQGCLLTPPLGPLILGWITRDLVLELADEHGVIYEETPISTAQLRKADEIWITSSTKDILPIILLDNQPVGKGKPGSLWQIMIDHYLHYRNQLNKVENLVN